MSLDHLTGHGHRRAEPGSAAAWPRRKHLAFQARVGNTVPYGAALPARPQETE